MPADEPAADPYAVIATLRAERDRALRALAERSTELIARAGNYGEQIEYQSATVDILKTMSGSPGGPQPVFELITRHAAERCNSRAVLWEFDGTLMHFRASHGAGYDMAAQEAIINQFPAPPTRGVISARAILEQRLIHITDATQDPEIWPLLIANSARSYAAIPLMRDGKAIGAISMTSPVVGGFSEAQIMLLRTFAEQAVIAITIAETYRTLRGRTSDLQEALEQQTATAEVLQVINASPGDLAPVFQALLQKAHMLCKASFGALMTYDGERFHPVAYHGTPAPFREYLGSGILPWPGDPFRLIADGAAFSHIHDLLEVVTQYPDRSLPRAAVGLGGVRTLLVVPLRKDSELLGVITAYRQETRPFTGKQIALLHNFAAQAVIAMENARLLTETREALEQQTATAEVLRVINTSPGDLAPVFETMLQKATDLCAAAFGILWTFDGEHYHAVAFRNVPTAYSQFLRDPPPATPMTPLGRIAAGEAFAQIADMADEIFASGGPMFNRAVELGGFRTILGVALRKDAVLLGAITIYRQEVQPFSDRQIVLLQNFAAQAVVAMENARLLTEQRWALEQQTATAEVLQVINASPGNLTPVFDAMLEKAMRLCEAAFGYLLSYNGEEFQVVAHQGLPPRFAEYLPRMDQPGPTGAYARILSGAPLVHFTDLMDGVGYQTSPIRRALVDLGGARTSLIVAIRREDRLLGIFTIYRREVRQFSDKQITLVEGFAAQAAIAMENARLINEVRQRQDELRITFENMGDGVAMFDEVPRLVAWNRKFQEMLDVPDAALAKRPTYADYICYLTERGEYGPEADVETQLRHFEDRLREHYDFERTRPDGRVIEVRHNPVSDGGFVLIYADITERKRSEEEIRAARDAAEAASRTIEAAYRDLKAAQASLIQAEKMASLGQLTAGIAHEIKNPLNFVNNFSDLSVDLLDELGSAIAPEKLQLAAGLRAEIDELIVTLKGNLEKIAQHGRRADSIVKNMLAHSRTGPSERRPTDLNAAVEEALSLAYHGARAETPGFNITIERQFDPNAGKVDIFPQDFIRVILNLVSNGFYAARRRAAQPNASGIEPTLRVTTRDLGEQVEIRVRDNGTGISDDVRGKIFEPFFTTKPSGEGTGLGLSLSYDIVVKQHGGQLTVDSQIDAFTEFSVVLPRRITVEGVRA